MKTSVNVYQFRDAFHAMGRKDQFSYAALGALFSYLEELESDLGEEIELDVIALCCDYAEYSDAAEAVREHMGFDWAPPACSRDELNETCLEWLRDRTTVIEFDTGVVIQQF